MATINLLPWREEYRAEKKKEFLAILGATLIGALIILFIWDRIVEGRISNQEERNQILNQEIAVLDKQVKEINELKRRRQEMLDRIQVIQNLQSNRPEVVRIFDELVKAVPDGLFLTDLSRKGNYVSLQGVAESNNRVSSLMRQLDASNNYENSNLTRVEANDLLSEDGSDFEMKVQIQAKASEANGTDVAGGANGG